MLEPTNTYPNPGKSTRYQLSLIRKWLMHCVFPASRKNNNIHIRVPLRKSSVTNSSHSRFYQSRRMHLTFTTCTSRNLSNSRCLNPFDIQGLSLITWVSFDKCNHITIYLNKPNQEHILKPLFFSNPYNSIFSPYSCDRANGFQ